MFIRDSSEVQKKVPKSKSRCNHGFLGVLKLRILSRPREEREKRKTQKKSRTSHGAEAGETKLPQNGKTIEKTDFRALTFFPTQGTIAATQGENGENNVEIIRL